MSVFRNYNPQQAGQVNANAFPRVHTIPWIPTQQNVRANPNIPSQPQRISPTERGASFPTSASNGGTLAPKMSSNCACGGSCNGAVTASSIATSHTFPGSGGKRPVPRPARRTTGALRSGLANNSKVSLTSLGGGRPLY